MPSKKGHKAAKPVNKTGASLSQQHFEDLDNMLDEFAVENAALVRQREHEEQRVREAQASAIARLQRDRAAMVVGGGCPERNYQLFRASLDGRATEVEKLIVDPFCDLNAPSHNDATALYAACANGHSRIVTMLLAAGADAYRYTTDGYTPLHVASEGGNKNSVQALLAHGVAPDLSLRREESGASSFLTGGAHLEPDRGGSTPLQLSCEKGFVEVVGLLLRFGADPNLADDEGFSPLYFAVRSHFFPYVRLAKIDQLSHALLPTPSTQAQEGHDQCCALLLERGALVDQPNVDGTSPLCIAAKNKREGVVGLLLRHGAKVDLPPDVDGDTILGVARMGGNARVISLLEQALAKQST